MSFGNETLAVPLVTTAPHVVVQAQAPPMLLQFPQPFWLAPPAWLPLLPLCIPVPVLAASAASMVNSTYLVPAPHCYNNSNNSPKIQHRASSRPFEHQATAEQPATSGYRDQQAQETETRQPRKRRRTEKQSRSGDVGVTKQPVKVENTLAEPAVISTSSASLPSSQGQSLTPFDHPRSVKPQQVESKFSQLWRNSTTAEIKRGCGRTFCKNPFVVFAKAHRAQVAALCAQDRDSTPGNGRPDSRFVTEKLGQCWRTMTADERLPYQKVFAQLKKRRLEKERQMWD